MRLALIDSGVKGRFDILKGALNTNDEVKRVRIAIARATGRSLIEVLERERELQFRMDA